MKGLKKILLSLVAMILVTVTSTSLAGTKIYYVHNDHLGTPKMMTDENQSTVWEANHTPFGEATTDEDPDGDGVNVRLNIRFPGQYYDEETNLHYNYFRDYDPSTGRYVQSDPIGLEGGLNTYAYALGNPVRYTDPSGLAVPAVIVGCASNPACVAGVLGILGMGVANNSGNIEWPDNPSDTPEQCDDDDERCEKAKADARSAYWNLVNKRIPQYTSGGTRGSDPRHRNSILQRQRALQKAIKRVRKYCRPLPPELPEWERVANMNIPILY